MPSSKIFKNCLVVFALSSFENSAIMVLFNVTFSKTLSFLSCLPFSFLMTSCLLFVVTIFSEAVFSWVFFGTCLDKFTGVHEIININI